MIRESLERLAAERVRSGRGDLLSFERERPAEPDELQFGERCLKAAPPELLDVLRYTNGCTFFGVRILSAAELYCTADGEIVFHDWGSGDVTAIHPGTGRIIYRGHDPFDKTEVAHSLEDWFQGVFQEIRESGYLWHPHDSYLQGRYSLYYPAPDL